MLIQVKKKVYRDRYKENWRSIFTRIRYVCVYLQRRMEQRRVKGREEEEERRKKKNWGGVCRWEGSFRSAVAIDAFLVVKKVQSSAPGRRALSWCVSWRSGGSLVHPLVPNASTTQRNSSPPVNDFN
jgi:hypothetical protein